MAEKTTGWERLARVFGGAADGESGVDDRHRVEAFIADSVTFAADMKCKRFFNSNAKLATSNRAKITFDVELAFDDELFFRLGQLDGQQVRVVMDIEPEPWMQPSLLDSSE